MPAPTNPTNPTKPATPTNSLPKVSVIIPIHNAGMLAVRLLKTLRSDPYENLEIIFIDDGSKDNSVEDIKTLVLEERLKNVKLFREPHKGIAAARNLGIEKSSGDYLIFLDVSDSLNRDFISALVSATVPNGPRALALTGVSEYLAGVGDRDEKFTTLTPNKKDKETVRAFLGRLLKHDFRLYPVTNKLFRADIIKTHNLAFKTTPASEGSPESAESLDFVLSYIKAGKINLYITINKPLYLRRFADKAEKNREERAFKQARNRLSL